MSLWQASRHCAQGQVVYNPAIKGVLPYYQGECAVVPVMDKNHVGVEPGAVIVDGKYPPAVARRGLSIPDDGEWYTVVLRLQADGSLAHALLPGLCWDYDADKVPLAGVRRWPGGQPEIVDRRPFVFW